MQIKHWLRKMLQFKFVATSLVLLDVDQQFTRFSKATQSDVGLVIDYPTQNEKFRAALEQCSKGILGSNVKRNLASLRAGTYAGIKLLGVIAEAGILDIREPDAIAPDIYI